MLGRLGRLISYDCGKCECFWVLLDDVIGEHGFELGVEIGRGAVEFSIEGACGHVWSEEECMEDALVDGL